MSRYVMVGCGPAACAAAEAVRQAEAQAEITLLSFEAVRTLARPQLVRYASRQIELAELESNDPAWFAERRLEVQLGVTVTGLSVASRTLRLAGGQTVPYDQLLVATGIQPRPAQFPGSDLAGVVVMNHQTEAEKVREAVERTRRAVVVGGGLLGQDMSMALRAADRQVTLLVREDRVGVPQWDSAGSEIVLKELVGLGIDVQLETEVARVEGSGGRVTKVITRDGREMACEMVFVAIGSSPRADWLAGSGVEVGRGVVVDEHLATAVPGIYAAGSCAEVCSCGRVLIQASWMNALAQGKTAGVNLAGGSEVYCTASDYMTKIGNTKFSLFGSPAAAYPKARFVGFRGGEGDYGSLLAEGGVVRGGVLAGKHPRAKEIKALQVRDEPVPGLAEMQGQQPMSVDTFVAQALGLA